MSAVATVTMKVTIYVRDRERYAQSEDVKAIWRVVHAAQQLGYPVRLDFYAARELIRARAFEDTWATLVNEANRELAVLSELYPGHGVTCSDVNHTVVGLVHGRRVLEPVA